MKTPGQLALALRVLNGSGCSTTLFESMPEGAITQSDSAWPGQWRQADESTGILEINADCKTATMREGDGSNRPEALDLTLVGTGKYQFVSSKSPAQPECFTRRTAVSPCSRSFGKAIGSGSTRPITPGSPPQSPAARSQGAPGAARIQSGETSRTSNKR